VHLVGYFHSCITMYGFMSIKNLSVSSWLSVTSWLYVEKHVYVFPSNFQLPSSCTLKALSLILISNILHCQFFKNNFYIRNSQPTKSAVLFLRYLHYNITRNNPKSFDPPGIITRGNQSKGMLRKTKLSPSSSSALQTWVGLGLPIKPN
jgi:hypothetical protein